jgi:hypothetical protein
MFSVRTAISRAPNTNSVEKTSLMSGFGFTNIIVVVVSVWAWELGTARLGFPSTSGLQEMNSGVVAAVIDCRNIELVLPSLPWNLTLPRTKLVSGF